MQINYTKDSVLTRNIILMILVILKSDYLIEQESWTDIEITKVAKIFPLPEYALKVEEKL